MRRNLHQMGFSLSSLLIALMTTGCFFPYESGMLLSRDIDALQKSMRDTRNDVEARGVQLEEQSEKLESQIRQADDKLGEVAETLDTLNRAARLSNADFGVQLERMLQELQELRGAIELADYRISRMEQQIAAKLRTCTGRKGLRSAGTCCPAKEPKGLNRLRPKASKPSPKSSDCGETESPRKASITQRADRERAKPDQTK